ncbi:hypothetical protein DC3_41560 [Deinococcus cellulosilyticus NBRC 106333 = KACC 11606]|uniref:Uncharacterized protein n=1 Tax=Deinococcus cellulosilyticus (strain DSM 18568 / NBRC 106333 / KACC 11606 / 5516J-15) TaxID=1223518 RepID=A0A511N7X3_DEIC1|nr:hypothetical protein DC3_41560 [Deinococcus cellulosilyticus NBRC 106333 = KACC 11606]
MTYLNTSRTVKTLTQNIGQNPNCLYEFWGGAAQKNRKKSNKRETTQHKKVPLCRGTVQEHRAQGVRCQTEYKARRRL